MQKQNKHNHVKTANQAFLWLALVLYTFYKIGLNFHKKKIIL